MIPEFLQNKLKENNWSLHHLHILTGGNVSGITYSSLRYILSGKTKKPEFETLRKLAKAFGDPLDVWMEAAGYTEAVDIEREAMRAKFGPLFNDNEFIDRVFFKPDFIEMLEVLKKCPQDKLDELLKMLKTVAKGFL